MMINRKRSMILASSLLGSASIFSMTAHANPAVFFNDDLNAGLQTFLDTAAAADAAYNAANPSGPTHSSLIFQLDLSTITGYRFAVTDASLTETVYVQTLRAGSAATNTGTGDEGGDGFTNWSVSYLSGDFSSAVSAGYELSFFTDASYTTPYLINAVGLNVSNWGTCCTTNNTTPDGGLANASQIYMLFDGSSPLLVGGIDTSIGGEEHFVAAIDDRNAFGSVTMVPNGSGEYFGAGGYLVFSTLALNSVPAGSSVVTVGSKIGTSDTATPDDLNDGSYDPTLDGGTLQFTEDGSVGNDLTVESGGTLDTGVYDVELSGVISGTNSGPLVKTGSGSLLLTGTNSFDGGYQIQDGTLIGSTTSLTGDVLNNASLVIDQDTDGSFGGDISGSGTFTKDGAGTVTLTGTNSYTGGTTIAGGTLNVDGYLTNSRVLVQNAARLTGQGVVAGISAASGSTIAPAGAAIGTLMVDGDIDFTSGSTLEINANADGQADLLAATGNVTIAGGTVQILAADGNYAPQTSYMIVSGESVEGSFDDVETDLAFLMPTLSYRSNGVGLLLTRNDVEFANVAETMNQIEVGSALNDAFAAESALYYAVVGQSAAGAREIFDNLSGEVHATVANALVQDGDRTRRAVLARIDTPRSSGLNLWLQGAGARDEWSSDRNASGYDRNSAGLLGGLDLQTGHSVVGVAAGYADGKLEMDQRLSQASVSGVTASAYAGTQLGPVSLSFGAQYADYDIDTDRSMVLSDIDQSVSGEYGAETLGAFARAGFKIPVGNGAIEPFLGVNWSRFERGGFAESGGTLALDAAAEKADWTFGSIGFKSIVPLDPDSPFSVSMSAEWQHALGDHDTAATLSFTEGEAFTIAGAPLAKDAALADLALNYRLADRIMAGLGYQGTIADYGMTNAVRASLSIGF